MSINEPVAFGLVDVAMFESIHFRSSSESLPLNFISKLFALFDFQGLDFFDEGLMLLPRFAFVKEVVFFAFSVEDFFACWFKLRNCSKVSF